ncbi:hypothetical protein ACFVHB_36595 [Kitasatospora sp. NPDC127111]|uniref:hypothetical protein n=1 Tax=Kitasatospora sp. NPDC127111 TaxID=3345363 RepID=UPI00364086CA
MADEPPVTGEVTQCTVSSICVGVHKPGSTPTPAGGGGGGGGGGGSQVCQWNGLVVACHDPVNGWFSSTNGCYYRTTSPQPGPEDPVWQGHKPSDGTIYDVTCLYSDGSFGAPQPTFFAQDPAPPPPDPAQLATDAWGEVKFPPVKPRFAPADTKVVGVPVWLWLDEFAVPPPAVASAGGVTVTVTPRLESVEWDLGDDRPEVCTGPQGAGTPYDAHYGAARSPTCGHEFRTGSAVKPGGVFDGTVRVKWVGKVDVTGDLKGLKDKTKSFYETFTVRVAEVQVLN